MFFITEARPGDYFVQGFLFFAVALVKKIYLQVFRVQPDLFGFAGCLSMRA